MPNGENFQKIQIRPDVSRKCVKVALVSILDEGSEFDAPMDKVWKYLQSEMHQHGGMRLISREVNGDSAVITGERKVNGITVRMKTRNTIFIPFGFVQEHLEGPTAGSGAFLFYIPKGKKTGVTVVGDYVASELDDQGTRNLVSAQSQAAFDEDNANLKKMV